MQRCSLILCLYACLAAVGDPPPMPLGLEALGLQRCNELHWQPVDSNQPLTYRVQRSAAPGGPFSDVASALSSTTYADPQPPGRARLYYRVLSETAGGTSAPSGTASTLWNGLTDEQLLDLVQGETFRYFWDYAHPHSGLIREGFNLGHSSDTCATGATGMGALALIVGTERGFVTRTAAADRLLRIVRFLDGADPDTPANPSGVQRYHGAWAHWVNGQSGATIPFSVLDDGGDLVETALLMQGLLAARKYFDAPDAVETEIRTRITDMWREVEWDWYRRFPGSDVLYWHWSPLNGWAINLQIRGYNEAQLVYLLAMASPTHPMPSSSYAGGWAGLGSYGNGQTLYGQPLAVGPADGGPLFLTQYSALGIDFRYQRDAFANYAEHARSVARAQREYARQNPLGFSDYSALGWGLTASSAPGGYDAHSINNDSGTIAPTAALAAMPFTPEASLRTMRYLYDRYGPSLFSTYGFLDAYNPTQNWFSPGYLGIDQGPILIMLENYRSGACWDALMQNTRIQDALHAAGFHFEVDFDQDDDIDATDIAVWLNCLDGVCNPLDTDDADLSNDGSVDLQDLAILQRLVSRP